MEFAGTPTCASLAFWTRRRMRSARAVSARAGTAAATSSTDREQLSRFSAGLYCGGAIDHHCPLPGGRRGVSGECFWLREKGNSWSPVATHDMQSSHLRNDLDRWDPSAFGQEGFRRFNKREAAQCLRPRRYAAPLLIARRKAAQRLMLRASECGAGSSWWEIALRERCTLP